MPQPPAATLLERWIYVLVKVQRDFVLPYTPEAVARILAEGGYPPGFGAFLEQVLAQIAAQPDWPAGSVFPGGWARQLVAQGRWPCTGEGAGEGTGGAAAGVAWPAVSPEALDPFRMAPLRVDADGAWWVGPKQLDMRVRGFLLRNLEWDAAVARYRVRYPLETHDETRYLQHASPPLRVLALHFDPAGWRVALNDGSEAALRPGTLRLDARERLYCAVRPEGLPAWFADAPRFALLDRAEEGPAGWTLALPGASAPTPLRLHDPWPGADRLPEGPPPSRTL